MKLKAILSDFVYTLIKIFLIRLDIPDFSDRLAMLILIKANSVYTTIPSHFSTKSTGYTIFSVVSNKLTIVDDGHYSKIEDGTVPTCPAV